MRLHPQVRISIPMYWHRDLHGLTGLRIAYSAGMDLVFALVPWRIILDLTHMRTKERIGIAVAMSMGVLWVSVLRNLSVTESDMNSSAAGTAIARCTMLKYLAMDDFACTLSVLS